MMSLLFVRSSFHIHSRTWEDSVQISIMNGLFLQDRDLYEFKFYRTDCISSKQTPLKPHESEWPFKLQKEGAFRAFKPRGSGSLRGWDLKIKKMPSVQSLPDS